MKKKFFLIFIIFAVFGLTLFEIFDEKNLQKESYSFFIDQVENKKICEVTLTKSKIIYKKNGNSHKKFKTENPQSPLLWEFLLKNDVKVNSQKNWDEIFAIIFDLLFFAIIFVAGIFAFKRVISPNSFKIVKKTGTNFCDVVGMENLKCDIKKTVEILKNPKKWAKEGVRIPKGILLEGAPGNGKTLFARALATEAGINFIATKATDFESMFMAIGPLKIKMLFAKARRAAPCIIFIDEFDGIGTRRNYSGSAIETENTRIVTALLNELDGFSRNSSILVVAATNNIAALDEALIRPGRFDAKYEIPFPNEKERQILIEKYSNQKNISKDLDIKILAKKFNGFSSAKIETVLNNAAILANMKNAKISMNEIDQAIKM